MAVWDDVQVGGGRLDFYTSMCNTRGMPKAAATLRELRERTTNPETGKPFTGEAVARAVGVTTNTYFRWEWGESVPTGTNLIRLETVLPGATHTLVSVKRSSAGAA